MQATVVVVFNHIPGVPGKLTVADRDIRRKGAFDLHAASLPWTPIATGALRGNVVVDEHGVHWLQFYAAFQNEGTVHIPPKLFAQHGYDVAVPGMLAAYRQLEGRLV